MLVSYKADLIIISFKVTSSRHDIAEKLLIWHWAIITHSHSNTHALLILYKSVNDLYLFLSYFRYITLENGLRAVLISDLKDGEDVPEEEVESEEESEEVGESTEDHDSDINDQSDGEDDEPAEGEDHSERKVL